MPPRINTMLDFDFQKPTISSGPSLSIHEHIQFGAITRLVEYLTTGDSCHQARAAYILACIAVRSFDYTKMVIDHGAVPLLVNLLTSPTLHVRNEAVWALTVISYHSPSSRDIVLTHGAMIPLLSHLDHLTDLPMLKMATSALTSFCRGTPQPPFEQVSPALPSLKRLIFTNDDEEILEFVCWPLAYISKRNNYDTIQAVIDAGVCARLVELLLHPSPSVIIPAIRTIGNIATGDDVQTQAIINHGSLPCLLNLLIHNHQKTIKQEACWIISNITAGNTEQIQAVIEAGLIAPLVNVLQDEEEVDIIKEAAWALSNAALRGTHEQIKYLASQGCIKPLCDLLVCHDPNIVTPCLQGLENFLKVGEAEKSFGNKGDVNLYAQMIDDDEGLDMILNLQSHDNYEIYEKAFKILQTYWFEDEDQALPPGNGSQPDFRGR